MSWRRAGLAAVALVLLSGHVGHCSGEEPAPRWPAHVIAWVLEHEDGAIEARVVAFSSATSGAGALPLDDVSITGGAERWPLDANATGAYEAVLETADGAGLAYDPATTFVVEVAVGEGVAADHLVRPGRLTLAAHGPHERPSFRWLSAPRDGEAAELAWDPAGRPAYVEVRDPEGHRRWANLEAPRAEQSWSLPAGQLTIPAGVIAPGDVVVACGCEVARRDDLGAAGESAPRPQGIAPAPQHLEDVRMEGALGWLSGVVVGRCRTLPVP